MNKQESGVSFSATLPLAWQASVASAAAQMRDRQHANVALLHALATLEALPVDLEKELGAAAKAYERLEAKLDVLLEMLASLLAERTPLAPPRVLTLWADRIEWLEDTAPPPGSELVLSLHLSPKLPQPLQLLARVEHRQTEANRFRVRARFLDLGEELSDWLERTVFRYHRRAVQQAHQTD